MAKGVFIGVSNKARKVKKAYIGVDGKARKIKKMYIGDANGKARLFWSAFTNKLMGVYSSTSGQKLISTENGTNIESVIYDATVSSSNYGAPAKRIASENMDITQSVFGNDMYLTLIELGTDGSYRLLKTIEGTDYKIIDISSFATPSATGNYTVPVLTFVDDVFYIAVRCSSGVRVARSYDGESWTVISTVTKAYTDDTTTTSTIGARFPINLLYGNYKGKKRWVMPTINSSGSKRVYYSDDLLEWHCDTGFSYDSTVAFIWGLDANGNVYMIQDKSRATDMSVETPTYWSFSVNVNQPVFVGKHPTKANTLILAGQGHVSELDTVNKTATEVFRYSDDVSGQIQTNKFRVANCNNTDYTKLVGVVYSKVGYSDDGATWTFIALDDNKALYSARINIAVAYD